MNDLVVTVVLLAFSAGATETQITPSNEPIATFKTAEPCMDMREILLGMTGGRANPFATRYQCVVTKAVWK